MTSAQFEAALDRHRIERCHPWYVHPDNENRMISAVFKPDGQMHRRKTLAKILQEVKRP